ncbi:DUF4190 domain-containing protein [Streptomyces sp. NPDC048507]|uniref:DUF4190 domain-containing protein n=1 Tax=Streptomyces sp. NPDC048507 TaxID=3365560 RepID=UPI00371F8AE0
MSSPPPPQQPPAGGAPQPQPYPYPQAARPVWAPPGITPRPPLNGFALASPLVGLVCLPPLGIAFGIVALVQIGRRGGRGRALAITGLVVSAVMSVVLVLGVASQGRAFLERLGAARPLEQVEGELTGLDELRAGDCFNVRRGDLLAEDPFIYRTGCERVHDAEVSGVTTVGTGLEFFPGSSKVEQIAEAACWKVQDDYARDTWALPGYADMYYFAPSRATWSSGDRGLVCVIGTPEREHRGSLRKDAGALTSDQAALLEVLNGADEALGEAPEVRPGGPLPEYRRWAGEVDAALGAQERLLRDASARTDVGPAAAARLREVEAARKEWQRASRAATAADFRQACDAARGAMSVEAEKQLRGAYGLSTRVPEWLEGSSEGEDGDEDGGGGSPGGGPSAESV